MALAREADRPHRRSGARRLYTRVEAVLRGWPIRWRIHLVVLVNALVVVGLAGLVWTGVNVLTEAWADLSRVRQSDWALASLESEAGRLQILLQRYFSQPDERVLAEIEARRQALAGNFATRVASDPALTSAVDVLRSVIDRSLEAFEGLREAKASTVKIYEEDVSRPAREMAGLYAIIDGASRNQNNLIWPSLGKSREAFSSILVAVNAYYLAPSSDASEEARRNLAVIERTIPVMLDLADSDLQKAALMRLKERSAALRSGLDRLAEAFATQSRLLRGLVEDNGKAMAGAIDTLSTQLREREVKSHDRFDSELAVVYARISTVALLSLLVIAALGVFVARTISGPLTELVRSMNAIVSGDYDRPIVGLEAGDEVGAMARTLDVFRGNAIARLRAEEELRAAKEAAEVALINLRNAQASLVEAEKLAALGGLVAGVAHEVNTPIGISLTIASSLAHRCEIFAREFEDGALRRSRVTDFIEGGREATHQLVANLERAGELIQSFKQVAVDRSQADRRPFDLREATEQMMSSLRPGLKKRPVTLDVAVPSDIALNSYPGAYGQVLTNLFVNATTHAFPGDRPGTIRVAARRLDADHVEVSFTDDGVGMSEEIQRRAFDPFFTTLRGRGGTGLGLNIVHNIVTRQLGGRIAVRSRPGGGTAFRLTLPLVAPLEDAAEPLRIAEQLDFRRTATSPSAD